MSALNRLTLHEGAHLVTALLLGLPVRSASVAPGRSCVELANAGALARSAGGLRAGALVAAAGPAVDRRFDPRGWRGYVVTDRTNDLRKVVELALHSSRCGTPFDAREVLEEADAIVGRFFPFLEIAAGYLAGAQTLDAERIRQLAPALGAGLLVGGAAR